MDPRTFQELKTRVDLMVRGVACTGPDARQIKGRMTVCNGLFLAIGASCRPTKTRLVPSSPYVLRTGTHPALIHRGRPADTIPATLLPDPTWVTERLPSGTLITDVLKPQHSGVVAASAFGCQLVDEGLGCKFCSATGLRGHRFAADDLTAALSIVGASTQLKSLNLNSGSSTSPPDHGYSMLQPFVRAAADTPCPAINVEIMPPDVTSLSVPLLGWLNSVRQDGATSLQLNIELWDEQLRQYWMPFKSRISRTVYLDIIAEAVRVFGDHRVYSVLLVGAQPTRDLVQASEALLSVGAFPLLEVFRPLLASSRVPDSYAEEVLESLLMVWEQTKLDRLLTARLTSAEGCLACGACSVAPLHSSGPFVTVSVRGAQHVCN